MDESPKPPIFVQPRMESRVYFFERQDGSIVPIDGDESAWIMYAHPKRVFVQDVPPKYLGQSDGRQYMQAAEQAKVIAKEQGVEAGQKFLKEAMEKEIEIARLNRTPPPDMDSIYNNKTPYQR